ncbi:hypothetical protein D3C79_878890 [compost metagenome]
MSTKSDDQVKRAEMAALFGILALKEPLDREEFLDSVSRLIDGQDNNTSDWKASRKVNGADKASHVILNV